MTHLTAAPPVEPPHHPVGHRTVHLVDTARDERSVAVDLWYPASDGADATPARYDLLPGVSFEAALARADADVAPGPWPLIVMSHGRTGMRYAYTLLCEALAARGAVVAAPDHAGDTLLDWLLGTHVDDTTNETNRVGDIRLVLDTVLSDPGLPIESTRVAGVGHSYGAHGLLAAVAGRRGATPEGRLRALALLQPYTRLLSDAALSRVDVPVLLVGAENDRTTPPSSDVDRPWGLLPGNPVWRMDLAGAAHQASSDMGLYAELADQVELPDIVRQYLEATTVDAVGPDIRPYRDLLAIQVDAVWRFLDQPSLSWSSSSSDRSAGTDSGGSDSSGIVSAGRIESPGSNVSPGNEISGASGTSSASSPHAETASTPEATSATRERVRFTG